MCADDARDPHQSSNIEKIFLFDLFSKLYLATDSSPVDMTTYEVCSDMIDVIADLEGIYGFVYSNWREVDEPCEF